MRHAAWRLGRLYFAGMALVCGATLAGFLARLWWPLELAGHFRVQYAVLLTIATITLLLLKKLRYAALCAVFMAANAAVIVPLYFGTSPGAAPSEMKRLVVFNVHTGNANREQVVDYLRSARADIVVLVEVDARWEAALQPLAEEYPFSISRGPITSGSRSCRARSRHRSRRSRSATRMFRR